VQHLLVICYQCFRTVYQSHLQESSAPRMAEQVNGWIYLDSVTSDWLTGMDYGRPIGLLVYSSHPTKSDPIRQSPTTVPIYSCIHLLQNSSWSAWPLKMGKMRCPKMLVTNYKPAWHNVPEQQISWTLKLLGLRSVGQYTVPYGKGKYAKGILTKFLLTLIWSLI
jgi:hypothetical protein